MEALYCEYRVGEFECRRARLCWRKSSVVGAGGAS